MMNEKIKCFPTCLPEPLKSYRLKLKAGTEKTIKAPKGCTTAIIHASWPIAEWPLVGEVLEVSPGQTFGFKVQRDQYVSIDFYDVA